MSEAIVTWAIPFLTPLLIGALKKAVGKLATDYKHLLPWLAPVLGCVAALAAQASSIDLPLGLGAMLGSAGVGIREALKPLTRRLANG
jgi:hypothetical protein